MFKKYGFIVLIIVILSTLGVTIIKAMNSLDNGLDQYTGEARVAAEHALFSAKVGCIEPSNIIFRRSYRVVEIKLEPGFTTLNNDIEIYDGKKVRSYTAKIRTYSFLGIPSGTINIESDDGISVRCVSRG